MWSARGEPQIDQEGAGRPGPEALSATMPELVEAAAWGSVPSPGTASLVAALDAELDYATAGRLALCPCVLRVHTPRWTLPPFSASTRIGEEPPGLAVAGGGPASAIAAEVEASIAASLAQAVGIPSLASAAAAAAAAARATQTPASAANASGPAAPDARNEAEPRGVGEANQEPAKPIPEPILEVLRLEQSYLRVPVEEIKRSMRMGSRLVEKELQSVLAGIRGADSPSSGSQQEQEARQVHVAVEEQLPRPAQGTPLLCRGNLGALLRPLRSWRPLSRDCRVSSARWVLPTL